MKMVYSIILIYDILSMIGDDMKRGFTLVELLAVIVILGFLSIIIVPKVKTLLDENELKIYKIKENEILEKAKDYANYDDNFSSPSETSPVKYITLLQLVEGNYMSKILDAKSGNECSGFVKVTLNSISGYDYEACLICDGYTTNKDFCNIATYQSL